jgi:protein-tyrosine phosphatase
MYVDVHSHVVPSGDDGAVSVGEGLALCREAASRGTRVLYGTPHVWPVEGLPRGRELDVRRAHAAMAAEALEFGLDLRLGFELTPARSLLAEPLDRYVLSGLDAPTLLVEFPFEGGLELLTRLCERADADGFRLVLGHPERAEAVLADPGRAEAFAERGWLLQVNGSSLLGRHGPLAEAVGWTLLERGLARLVASDGHRPSRPPHLDEASALAASRLGGQAAKLFTGAALGFGAPAAGCKPARAGSA